MFYNGNAKLEPGAVVCRVARSFVRFGTFQLPATRWVGGWVGWEWGAAASCGLAPSSCHQRGGWGGGGGGLIGLAEGEQGTASRLLIGAASIGRVQLLRQSSNP